jgi:hypothetical protein
MSRRVAPGQAFRATLSFADVQSTDSIFPILVCGLLEFASLAKAKYAHLTDGPSGINPKSGTGRPFSSSVEPLAQREYNEVSYFRR